MTVGFEKFSDLTPLTAVPSDARVPIVSAGRNYALPAELLGAPDRFNVKAYGATGLGVADDTAAFTAADAAATPVGGTVYVPKGTYNVPTFALSSGVTLEGDGDASVLLGCHITTTGTAGNAIAFTAPSLKGATSIALASAVDAGTWLRLASCINMQSSDAGVDQLGHDPTAGGYFSEYVSVKTAGVAPALMGATFWPYSNTPGADTDVAFTTSVARVMAFHESGRIRRIKMLGKNAAFGQNISAKFCRDLVIDDVTLDSNDTTSNLIRMDYCLDCRIVGGRYFGQRTSVPTGGTANPVLIVSSQACLVSGASLYYGNQGLDFDCIPNDTTYRGGPCIQCGAVACRAFDQATDNYTSHWGCYGSFFDSNMGKGAPRGIRLRDRGSRASGNTLRNGAGTGIGVLVDNAAVVDSLVQGNEVDGYLQGITFAHSATGYATLEVLLGTSQCLIDANRVRNSVDYGILCNTAYTAATLCGPRITNNDVRASGKDSINIAAYNNGTIVEGNRLYGVPDTFGGVRYAVNVARLWIGTNHIYGVAASAFAILGPGVASFMTDAVTFPAGEAAALLRLGPQFTDAPATQAFQSVIRDQTAFVEPQVFGFASNNMPMRTASPAVQERQSLTMFLTTSTNLRIQTKDSAGAIKTADITVS